MWSGFICREHVQNKVSLSHRYLAAGLVQRGWNRQAVAMEARQQVGLQGGVQVLQVSVDSTCSHGRNRGVLGETSVLELGLQAAWVDKSEEGERERGLTLGLVQAGPGGSSGQRGDRQQQDSLKEGKAGEDVRLDEDDHTAGHLGGRHCTAGLKQRKKRSERKCRGAQQTEQRRSPGRHSGRKKKGKKSCVLLF